MESTSYTYSVPDAGEENNYQNLDISNLDDQVINPEVYEGNLMVIGGSGLTWHLQSTKKYNNLSLKQFEVQLGGEYQHAGIDNIGQQAVKTGLSGKHWYTVKRYTAKNAGHVYLKVVAKIYSNSSRTHKISTLEEEWRA